MKSNYLLTVLLFLVSCSGANHSAISSYTASLDASENSVKKARELEKESDLMHHFVIAELAYQNENIELALKKYYKIREISTVIVPKAEAKIVHINLLKSNYIEAAKAQERLIQIDDKSRNYLLISGIYHALEDSINRNKYVEEGLLKYPKDEGLQFFSMIYDYLDHKDVSKTQKKISKNKNILPTKLAYHFLAMMYEYYKEYKEAVKYYRIALQEDDNNSILVEDLTRTFLRDSQFQQAKSFLKHRKIETVLLTAIKAKLDKSINKEDWEEYLEDNLLSPNDNEIINMMRLKYAQKDIFNKKQEEGLEILHILLADIPDYVEARFLLASILVNTGKMNEGIREFEKIEVGQKLYLRSRVYAALVLRKDKNYEKALELVQEALEEFPKKTNLHSLHINLQREMKSLEGVRDAIEDALDEYPNNDNFLFQYSGVLFELGDKEEAHDLIDEILERNPDHIDALNFLAYMYSVNNENLDEALEKINIVLKKSPGNPYYLDTLAWIYYKQKRYEEAKEVQRKALKRVPDDPVMLEHYADILLALGDKVGARDYYIQSLREAKDANPSVEIDELKERLEKKLN